MIIGDFQPWNEVEFKRWSRQLDLLSRGDFSPIKTEIAKAFKNTDLPVRAIPFVSRYVAELSGLYERPVVRRFKPSTLPQATWQTLQAVYADSNADGALSALEKALWVQNTVFAVVMPDGIGKVRIVPIQPWQIDEVVVGDPMTCSDPSTWDSVKIQIPATVVANQVVYGTMKLTATEAWRDVGGKRVGIYATNGTHPFGRLPIIAAHRVECDPGRHCAPVNEAVLNLQIALSLQQADNELIIRHCAYPQKVLENADVGSVVEEVTMGPDKVYVLPKTGDPSGPSSKLSYVQGQVPVAELVSWAEHQIRLYCAMLGLDPSSFLRVNTAVTASARLFASQDRAAQRDKIMPTLARLENDLLRMIVAVLRLGQPLPSDLALSVTVQYMTADASADPLHDAQALEAGVKMLIDNPVDVIANRDGIGRTEATAKAKQNRKDAIELGLLPDTSTPPPIDPPADPVVPPMPDPVMA